MSDIKRIEEHGQDLGKCLNIEKSDLVSHDHSYVI